MLVGRLTVWHALGQGPSESIECAAHAVNCVVYITIFTKRLAQCIVRPICRTAIVIHARAVTNTIRARIIIIGNIKNWTRWAIIICTVMFSDQAIKIIVVHANALSPCIGLAREITKNIICIEPITHIWVGHLDLVSVSIVLQECMVSLCIRNFCKQIALVIIIVRGGIQGIWIAPRIFLHLDHPTKVIVLLHFLLAVAIYGSSPQSGVTESFRTAIGIKDGGCPAERVEIGCCMRNAAPTGCVVITACTIQGTRQAT